LIGRTLALAGCLSTIFHAACAPIEYSVIIVKASKAIAEAETAGASCTQDQLDSLSPVTENRAPDPGTELASSDDETSRSPAMGGPTCDAPYEYYSAVEYRQKAREEVSHSDFQVAVDYARESRRLAEKARDIALNRDQERGR
jgi:hypothetical protein